MVRRLTWLLVIALAASAFLAWRHVRGPVRPQESSPVAPSISPQWPDTPNIDRREWGVLRASTSAWLGTGGASNAAPGRYRLAGTFLVAEGGDSPEAGYRKAILDDMQAKRQHLLGEGETVDDLRVVRVHSDRVVVDIGGRVEVLGLGFTGGAGEAPAPVSAVAAEAAGMEALETTRFGKRVQENRWLLNREELMRYYRDILDAPERIAKLYDTFRPDYAEGKISGYQIAMQGEEDFLRDVGLREGDKVRMVNSMHMTSQSRAEFFLGEFVKERLNAVVLDIERDGNPQKIIYLIR
jgi:type II secretory pathway component PulC